MAYYLPNSSVDDGSRREVASVGAAEKTTDMSDLKVFWGPDICRLEYLVHLLDSGRIKDDFWPHAVPSS